MALIFSTGGKKSLGGIFKTGRPKKRETPDAATRFAQGMPRTCLP
jgi:hypothetical protein